MPIFEYKCDACDKTFEKLVFANDTERIRCPECNSPDVTKQMSAGSFTVTGSGGCAPGGATPFS
ncbi:MAG: zinc ribbon domain-containing protein [Desulfobacter sp.]